MAMTKHDAIVQAFLALCLDAPALAGGHIETEVNDDPMPEGVDESLQISLLDSQPTRRGYGTVDWLTTIRVACKARRDEMDVDGRPTSTLGAAVYARVMADTTLAGLAETVEPPRMSADVAYLRTRIGVLNLDFPVRHRTAGLVIT